MSKPKSEPVTKWCVLNPNFSLTAEENAIINRHDALWKEHCDGGVNTDAASLALEHQGFENAATHGDERALELLKSFPTVESLTRYRRAEQAGRRRRFDCENCGTYEQTKPIAARLRGVFEKMLADYRSGGESERQLLGLSPIIRDDCTALLERQIATLFAAESRTPGVFETLANHVALIEIEEEQP